MTVCGPARSWTRSVYVQACAKFIRTGALSFITDRSERARPGVVPHYELVLERPTARSMWTVEEEESGLNIQGQKLVCRQFFQLAKLKF